MSATYPLAIKTFTTKRNLLDDVDASHINDIQDEIRAIEQVLGINPQNDPGLPYNNTQQWKSVAARLHDIQRNLDTPLAIVGNHGRPYQTIHTERDNQFCHFSDVGEDTHGLFNGTDGLKIKRPGWYMCEGEIAWFPSTIKGRRVVGFDVNGGAEGGMWSPATFWADGIHPSMGDMALSTSAIMPLQRNQVVRLKASVGYTYENSQNIEIQWSHLRMFWIRDLA